MGVSDFFVFVRKEFLLLYIGRNSVIAMRGCRYKIWKKWEYQKKRKIVRVYERGTLFMRAKTEKFRCLFCTRETKEGCIMQKCVYTLVYFV